MNMKTMMKKCGVYAVFAVALLVMAALVTGCPTGDGGGDYKPPAGMGAVRLNLDNTVGEARSIVPGTTIDTFTKFTVQFAAVSGSGAVSVGPVDKALATVGGPYDLVPGTYNITVVGFIGSGEAALGTASNQVIQANQVTAVPKITLTAYDFADGDTGTFQWTITNSVDGLTSAIMSFTRIDSGTDPTPSNINLKDTSRWNSSIDDFPVGSFYVDFLLVARGDNRTFRHILHIYKNQISAFTYTFDNTYFTWAQTGLNVEYNPPADAKPTITVNKNNGGATATAEGATVTVKINSGSTADTAVITVTNTNYGSNTIEWYLNGTAALSGGILSGTNNSVLTVTAGSAPFTAQGKFPLTIVGTPSAAPSTPSSTVIFIEVTE